MATLASGLASRGHDATVFTYYSRPGSFQDELEMRGVNVISIDKKRRFSIRPAIEIRNLLTTLQCDAALAFMRTPCVYLEMARLRSQVPVIVSERSSYVRPKLGERIRLSLHRLADRITVNSHHHRQRLATDFPWMSSKIETIYNGLDVERFCRRNRHQRRLPKLVSVGRLVESKNAKVLAEALVMYQGRHGVCPSVDWIGRVADRSYRNECDRVLSDAGLAGRWNWRGEIPSMDRVYDSYDGLVHPSRIEGCPNVIGEAMACETPVLANDFGDHRRIISDGETGFIFDSECVESVYRSLRKFSELSVSRRAEMGGNARIVAKRLFSIERYIEEYETLFAQVANI